jgi:protein TonB
LASASLHGAALALWLSALAVSNQAPDPTAEWAMALDLDLFAPSPAAGQSDATPGPTGPTTESPALADELPDEPPSSESPLVSAAEVADMTTTLPAPPPPEPPPAPAPAPEDPPQPPEVAKDLTPRPRPAPDPEPLLAKAERESKPKANPVSKPKPKPTPKPKPKPESKPTPKPKTDLERPAPARRDVAASDNPQTRPRPPAPGSGTRTGRGDSDSRAARQPAGASAAEKSRAERAYLAELQRAIGRHQRFPDDARERQKTGTATLSFVIKSDGRIRSVRLAKSSGDPSLDRAALEALHRLDRFKPIPLAVGRASWSLRVPIRFDLR